MKPLLILLYFCGMMNNDDLQVRWWNLEAKMVERFGKKPDLETILFLIGVQELGGNQNKYSKEQKQELMHVAVCRVLSTSGHYALDFVDNDQWPHYKQVKPLPEMDAIGQENYIKDHVLLYFSEQEF